MKLPFVLAGTLLALSACNLAQNLGGGSTGGGTTIMAASASSASASSGTAPPGSCTDGVRDGAETDVDCGGPTCHRCVLGKTCDVAADCASGDCAAGVCISGFTSSCKDGVKNGAETDVDCGGPVCPTCMSGKACAVDGDCTSGDCAAGVCASGGAPSCTDGIKDGNETDVDCGGSCAPCADGKQCKVGSDCASDTCAATGTCAAAATCTDAVKDGAETDVDCGGATCPPCAEGKSCLVNSDCSDGTCHAGICMAPAPPLCADGIKNGNETDIDCGGGTCPPCSVAQSCKLDADCTSNACDALTKVCDAGQCADHLEDGTETDVDCGGGACPTCSVGKKCKVDTDCTSKACDALTLVCVANECADHLEDGTETDVDCGGGVCPTCSVGKKCKLDADCTSNACDAITLICVTNQCADHVKDGAETDVDCGGGTCPTCATGKSCLINADCTGNSCVGSTCH